MELLNLYSEIQANPLNINSYRNLVRYYRQHGFENEAAAFEYLIESKNGSKHLRADEEQPGDG